MNPSDAELIRRFAEHRANDAFAELVRRHIDLVFRVAMRKVGSPHLAEDVTQAVFTALAWKASALVHHQTIVGWLHTATRFAANEVLRAERRRRRHEQEARPMTEISSEPAEHVAWEQLRPVIDDVLGELGARDREVVLRRFFSDQSFVDIGAALQMSENAARMRVDRALDKLHGLLAKRGLTSTSATLVTVLANHVCAASAPATLAASVTSAALVSATAGTSAGATTMAFLSVAKIQPWIAAAAALAFGGAIYQGLAARRLETRHEMLRAGLAAQREATASLERELVAVRAQHATLREKTSAAETKAAVNRTAMPAAGPESQLEIIRDRYLQRRAVARSDPEYQRLHAELRKREIQQRFDSLLRRLKLPPEQNRQFETILADYEQSIDDIQAAADTKRVPVWDPAVDTLQAAARDELSAKLRVLLGDAGYAEYQYHQSTAPLRSSVTDLVAIFAFATSTPLTGGQAEALTRILDRHTPPSKDGLKSADDTDWAAALAEAERVLTPIQQEALRAAQAQVRWSNVLARALSPMVGTAPPAKSGGG